MEQQQQTNLEQLPQEAQSNQASSEIEALKAKEKEKFAKETQLINTVNSLKQELDKYKELESKIKENNWDLTVLAHHKNFAGNDPLAEVKRLQNEVSQLNQSQVELKRSLVAKQELDDIKRLVSNSGDEYELIKTYGLEEEVQLLIEKEKRENRFLSFEEAAKFLEQKLEETTKNNLKTLKNCRKIKSDIDGLLGEDKVKKPQSDIRKSDNKQASSATTTPQVNQRSIKSAEGFWAELSKKYSI